MSYASEFQRALTDPEAFWREKAEALPWYEFPPTILDQDPNGAWRWFRGGKTNTAWLALDRHVEALGSQIEVQSDCETAIILDDQHGLTLTCGLAFAVA